LVEGAWKQKDAAQIREQSAQDEVLSLREKLDESEQMVAHLNEKRLAMSKRDDGKERERLTAEIADLNKRLQLQRTYATELDSTIEGLEAKNKELLKLLDVICRLLHYYPIDHSFLRKHLAMPVT